MESVSRIVGDLLYPLRPIAGTARMAASSVARSDLTKWLGLPADLASLKSEFFKTVTTFVLEHTNVRSDDGGPISRPHFFRRLLQGQIKLPDTVYDVLTAQTVVRHNQRAYLKLVNYNADELYELMSDVVTELPRYLCYDAAEPVNVDHEPHRAENTRLLRAARVYQAGKLDQPLLSGRRESLAVAQWAQVSGKDFTAYLGNEISLATLKRAYSLPGAVTDTTFLTDAAAKLKGATLYLNLFPGSKSCRLLDCSDDADECTAVYNGFVINYHTGARPALSLQPEPLTY